MSDWFPGLGEVVGGKWVVGSGEKGCGVFSMIVTF